MATNMGIRLYADNQICSIKEERKTNDRWHIILSKDGSVDNRLRILPSPLGLEGFLGDESFKGYLLSIPSSAAVEMGFANDISLYLNARAKPDATLDDNAVDRLEKYFQLIMAVTRNSGGSTNYTKEELKCLCQSLLATCNKYYPSNVKLLGGTASKGMVKEFIKLVICNCQTKRNLDFYANALQISPKHLSNIVSKTTGKQASAWVRDNVVLLAKRLLSNPGSTIKEVSELMAFSSASDFSRYFKRGSGISPNKYKQQNNLI